MYGEQATMARAGRKRKFGSRYKSGDLANVTEKVESASVVALRQPHRRGTPTDSILDPRADTPLGVLNIIGAVSNGEYATAGRLAWIVRRYKATVLSSPRQSQSLLGQITPSEPSPLDVSRKAPANDDDDPVDIKKDYQDALKALEKAGKTAYDAVFRMAVDGEPCPFGQFGSMIRGLRLLREHFELTDKAKSLQLGN